MEVQTVESGHVSTCRRGWESETSKEVQALAPKNPKAQALAKQLHQLGGAFLLPHMQFGDAWALTVFAERARRNPENPLTLALCRALAMDIGLKVKPDKRKHLLSLLPEALQSELTPKLSPKPKINSIRSTLVHQPAPAKGFWRSLLGV